MHMTSMSLTVADLPIGTTIYYTGDMANHDGTGSIVAHRPATKWGPASVDVLMEDGRTMNALWPNMFEGSIGQRFYRMTDWQAKQAAARAEMEAYYAKAVR